MKGTRSRLIALEPRLLFDGAMAATPDPASDGDGGKPNQHQPTDGDGQAPATQADSPAGAGAPARHLVVVDARLSDAQRQTIREGLADDAELLEVDADENGIEAITAALAGMDQVESVEIFSHGASGQFQLGDTLVGNDTLTSLTASLGQWREALTADADLLLYGCRIGATDAGLELVEGLASATGMDVGASTDDTGHSGLGGDWERSVNRVNWLTTVAWHSPPWHPWMACWPTPSRRRRSANPPQRCRWVRNFSSPSACPMLPPPRRATPPLSS